MTLRLHKTGIEFPDGSWQYSSATGGGGSSTLESLGIPNHDQVTVDADGNVSVTNKLTATIFDIDSLDPLPA